MDAQRRSYNHTDNYRFVDSCSRNANHQTWTLIMASEEELLRKVLILFVLMGLLFLWVIVGLLWGLFLPNAEPRWLGVFLCSGATVMSMLGTAVCVIVLAYLRQNRL